MFRWVKSPERFLALHRIFPILWIFRIFGIFKIFTSWICCSSYCASSELLNLDYLCKFRIFLTSFKFSFEFFSIFEFFSSCTSSEYPNLSYLCKFWKFLINFRSLAALEVLNRRVWNISKLWNFCNLWKLWKLWHLWNLFSLNLLYLL